MDHTRTYYLVRQYLGKSLTETEQDEFRRLLQDPLHEEDLLGAFEALAGELDINATQDKNLLPLLQLALESDKPAPRVRYLRRWSWAAASVILLLAAGIYFLAAHKKDNRDAAAVKPMEIKPGSQGAILTLADGSEVVLDSLGNGLVARQNGARVVLTNGQLAYDPAEIPGDAAVFNTISTPKGRQFHVRLPDGTQVWLNAASSIRYPTFFSGSERKVEVAGEAYFEVAKNAKMPFRVSVANKAEIEVLGTHFNLNAYENEQAIATTLLEGSVRVSAPGAASRDVILQPGQQAQIARSTSGMEVVKNADTDRAVAWKNGVFHFEGVPLAEIMRQLERWYDIEVVYENGVPDIAFEGEMTRDVPLNGLLVMLKRTDIHFRIEGRKLIVMN
jgi:ferric-dicitrate binding protein FerR (iron transport regulator)